MLLDHLHEAPLFNEDNYRKINLLKFSSVSNITSMSLSFNISIGICVREIHGSVVEGQHVLRTNWTPGYHESVCKQNLTVVTELGFMAQIVSIYRYITSRNKSKVDYRLF